MFTLLLLVACASHTPPAEITSPVVDVAIVPGCPTEDDGALSTCLWRRSTWAARLYELGVAEEFIASGSAAYNRYIEAEAIAAGMEALGVPRQAIHIEDQALHTDENIGYSWLIAQREGLDRIGIASDAGQARGACSMLRAWGHADCTTLPVDNAWTYGRMKQGLPDVRVSPVAEGQWMSIKERERAIAEARGVAKRPPSWIYYSLKMLPFGDRSPPKPPQPDELALLEELAAQG